MTKKIYNPTHIRVYDENGIIYEANPNMNAYELVHTLIELQKDLTVNSGELSLDFEYEII